MLTVRISIIAAVARNNVIGCDNTLPWHLPEDLRHFRRLTLGKPVIMGRKTWDSIGKPLPGRTCIVVSRRQSWQPEGVAVAESLNRALDVAGAVLEETGGDEVVIMGGEEIYRQAMPLSTRLYLTEVEQDVSGDTWFPAIDADVWRAVARQAGDGGPEAPAYAFVVYDRVSDRT